MSKMLGDPYIDCSIQYLPQVYGSLKQQEGSSQDKHFWDQDRLRKTAAGIHKIN